MDTNAAKEMVNKRGRHRAGAGVAVAENGSAHDRDHDHNHEGVHERDHEVASTRTRKAASKRTITPIEHRTVFHFSIDLPIEWQGALKRHSIDRQEDGDFHVGSRESDVNGLLRHLVTDYCGGIFEESRKRRAKERD